MILEKVLKYLTHLQKYISNHLENELLWPLSMPCSLDKDIPIANYGKSDTAKEKHIYREGLARRYGKNMQMISGIHVNFSLGDDLLKTLHQLEKTSLSMKEFKNNIYFHLTQNFLHENWLLSYLFGASPTCDKTYLDPKSLMKSKGYATSLRMSPFPFLSPPISIVL